LCVQNVPVQVDADPVEVQGTSEEIGRSKVTEAVRILRAKGGIPEGRSNKPDSPKPDVDGRTGAGAH